MKGYRRQTFSLTTTINNDLYALHVACTIYICSIYLHIIAIYRHMKQINRLKAVLAEHGKTGKWLAQVLGKNESTVSRWCTNEVQPTVETLMIIADTLKIDIKELFYSTTNHKNEGNQI